MRDQTGEAPPSFAESLKLRWFRRLYLKTAYYDRQYENYLKFFQKEQILVLLFEEVQQNPLGVLRRVFEFLEVDADYYATVFDKRINAGRSLKNLTLHYGLHHGGVFLQELLPYGGLGEKASRLLSRLNRKINIVPYKEKETGRFTSQIEPELYQRLKDEFRPSNQRLAELTGIDLSFWESDRQS